MKDEKNIRRRVYDAINVQISVGAIKKNSNKVESLSKSALGLERKIQKLKEITGNYLRIKGLIEKNKRAKGIKDLFLPYALVVAPQRSEKTLRVLTNSERTVCRVKLDQSFKIHSCTEILNQINIDYDLS